MAGRRSVWFVVFLTIAVLLGVLADLGITRHSVSRAAARHVRWTAAGGLQVVDRARDVGTYNCAGLAFGNYRRMSLDEVEGALAGFRRLGSGEERCPPGWVKVWVWEYDVHHETEDGWVERAHRDGHLVAGRTSLVDGSGPGVVYCKYGAGPVEGPGAPESWVPPKREEVGVNRFGKRVFVVRENFVERWYCAPEGALPR